MPEMQMGEMKMKDILMDILNFLGRFKAIAYKIENKAMDTQTGKSKHTLTIELEGK